MIPGTIVRYTDAHIDRVSNHERMHFGIDLAKVRGVVEESPDHLGQLAVRWTHFREDTRPEYPHDLLPAEDAWYRDSDCEGWRRVPVGTSVWYVTTDDGSLTFRTVSIPVECTAYMEHYHEHRFEAQAAIDHYLSERDRSTFSIEGGCDSDTRWSA